ncbi:MAG: thiolase domain-containing protein [Anaerolineales bacterium]|jgi:acetyl-CoA C-acetyltransferase|nr:thiolase domain-containing protein [Anaerolineales bacterium]
MRPVVVAGVGMIPFERRDEDSLVDMLAAAGLNAMDDAGLGNRPVDSVYVGNMASGLFNHQVSVASALVDRLSLLPAAAERVENGPASGGSAIKNGFLAVASGFNDVVLVVGGEKMREVIGPKATDIVACMTHPQAEYIYGVTLPAMAGMFARLYMEKYGVTREHLSMVAIKNQTNGLLNPYAHIQMKITMEGILTHPQSHVNSPVVADPIHLYDCCPVSDGAAAVLLTTEEIAKKLKKPLVTIDGIGQATDTHTLQERSDPTDLKAVTLASEQAFKMAGIKPKDIDVAELHDAFTILEIAESEHAGFFPKGEGAKALERGETQIGGKLPINPSGGLKARGHPVGATGVAQVVELVWQLRGEAGERQVKDAANGFSLNFGGFGNNVLAFVLRRKS